MMESRIFGLSEQRYGIQDMTDVTYQQILTMFEIG